MKLWVVHIRSESSDHYYLSFRCKKRPTETMIKTWWDKELQYGEKWDSEDGSCSNFSIQDITEADPKSPELK